MIALTRSWFGSHVQTIGMRSIRGVDALQESLFTVAEMGDFVPADQPMREIRVLVNTALARIDAHFDGIWAMGGRDSIAPEKLIRALLRQVFYLRLSGHQLCGRLQYNL